MARYRIDMPEHGKDAGIDIQFEGEHEMTKEEIAAFEELARLAFRKMVDEDRSGDLGFMDIEDADV